MNHMFDASASLVLPRGSSFSLFKSSSSDSSCRWLGFLHRVGGDYACFNLRQNLVFLIGTKNLGIFCWAFTAAFYPHHTVVCAAKNSIGSDTFVTLTFFCPLQPLFFTFTQLSTQLKLIECNFSLGFSLTSPISTSHICTRLLLWGITKGLRTLGFNHWGILTMQDLYIFNNFNVDVKKLNYTFSPFVIVS